jgi:hypothetical protein
VETELELSGCVWCRDQVRNRAPHDEKTCLWAPPRGTRTAIKGINKGLVAADSTRVGRALMWGVIWSVVIFVGMILLFVLTHTMGSEY